MNSSTISSVLRGVAAPVQPQSEESVNSANNDVQPKAVEEQTVSVQSEQVAQQDTTGPAFPFNIFPTFMRSETAEEQAVATPANLTPEEQATLSKEVEEKRQASQSPAWVNQLLTNQAKATKIKEKTVEQKEKEQPVVATSTTQETSKKEDQVSIATTVSAKEVSKEKEKEVTLTEKELVVFQKQEKKLEKQEGKKKRKLRKQEKKEKKSKIAKHEHKHEKRSEKK